MEEQWHGVNLGGWLVLEKWMTPSLFKGTTAQDEYQLSQQLGLKKATSLLKKHREKFITEADFVWIAEHGLNTVRLPVGYWVFGDTTPYIGTMRYVDMAFTWANKHHLGVILDLHGAPGSQNGKDHSGQTGKVAWGDGASIERTLEVLEHLAIRYGKNPALLGIELMNEPSYQLGRRKLMNFYELAYERIRRHCSESVAVIFHDAFHPKRWKNVLIGPSYEHVVLDHHYYQVFGWRDRHRSLKRHLQRPKIVARRIQTLQNQRPVIIGEWSLALPKKSQNQVNGLAMKAYAEAQLKAMRNARGWFFWSYKTENGGAWNYRDCVRKGWLPGKYE